ncbi:MAG: putative rane protein [Bacilli bacterium]|nr:putative rane protein [Bacilli bacterium]
MEHFTKNRWFAMMVYGLLALFILFMLMQISSLISGLYNFLSAVLAPFAIAMIISYVLNPIVNVLHKRRVPRTIAIMLIYAVFITSLTVILMNLIPIFMNQLIELNEHVPKLTMKAQNLMDTLNDNRFLPQSVRMGINNSLIKFEAGISQIISDYINGIGDTINMLFIAFIIPFLAFYILKDFRLMEKSALTFVPKNHREKAVKLLIDIDLALGSYIRGQFLVCIIIGFFAYIGYWLVGMPYTLLLASVVAIFNIVPYLGPFLGAAPALIMASTISWKMMLYVVLVNTIVQILESNIISPQIVGRTLHMHPLWIIFALLVGGEVAGMIGLILAVPFFAVLKVIIQHFILYYNNRKTI